MPRMAIGHRTWTVLPHDPIEVLAPNLWRVEGVMGKHNRRVMALARLDDGRIVMHNAIALDEPNMAKIDAWGDVAAILVPNGFHRQDAAIMQARYPKAKVYAPRGSVARASRATPCAGSYGDVPTDTTVTLRELKGVGEREGVVLVRSDDGVSAVFCDVVLNVAKMSGILGFVLHPTGVLSVPRITGWLTVKDKQTLKNDLVSISELPGLMRVIPGHGSIVASLAPEKLRGAAERFCV